MYSQEIEEIIIRFQDELFRFAYFRIGVYTDAQEIVQNVFIRFYTNSKHTIIENIKAYLYKSISNECINYTKMKKQKFYDLEEAKNINCDAFAVFRDEKFKIIKSLLGQIPEDQAKIIHLRIIDELSFTEISKLLETPLTTVKSRFKYGIDKLKIIVQSKNYYHELSGM